MILNLAEGKPKSPVSFPAGRRLRQPRREERQAIRRGPIPPAVAERRRLRQCDAEGQGPRSARPPEEPQGGRLPGREPHARVESAAGHRWGPHLQLSRGEEGTEAEGLGQGQSADFLKSINRSY